MSRYFDWPTSLKRFLRGDTARAEDVNNALDQLSAGMDTLDQDVDRSIKAPPGESLELNFAAGLRAGKVLAFDNAGEPIVISAGWHWRGDWTTGTQYGPTDMFRNPVTKDIYAVLVSHVSTSIGADLSAGYITLAVNLVDVENAKNTAVGAASTATGAASAASVSASNAHTSELNAAQSESNASTSEGNALASKNAAALSASNASTSEGNAAQSESLARDWSNKMGSTVVGSEYSAKYYATQAAAATGVPPQSGNAKKLLTTDGTNASWQAVSRPEEMETKTANFNAAVGGFYACDTSSGSFTATLPASPSIKSTVSFLDLTGSFKDKPLVLARNGVKIMGFSENHNLDMNNVCVTLVYTGSAQGWRIA